MTYDGLLDERCMSVWRSPSGLKHVESWFNLTVCGKYIHQWEFDSLTSLRHIGRMSRNPKADRMCKNCASEYKDVNVDG